MCYFISYLGVILPRLDNEQKKALPRPYASMHAVTVRLPSTFTTSLTARMNPVSQESVKRGTTFMGDAHTMRKDMFPSRNHTLLHLKLYKIYLKSTLLPTAHPNEPDEREKVDVKAAQSPALSMPTHGCHLHGAAAHITERTFKCFVRQDYTTTIPPRQDQCTSNNLAYP